ncbi:MAG: serine/threonine protein kinase, partial [Solirubrobacterales bacterium]|nr:serine/threonine protein kinase [Solirubrobacterales bacterium]
MGSFTRTTQTRFQVPAATAEGHGAPEPPGLLVLSRYRLHRPLGTGGFGTVWMARDERLERDVAVKVLAVERVVGGRFEREARAAARLSHPGIVTLYEAAVDDDGAYLVSELVRGATLSQLLDAGRLSDRDVVEVGISLSEALGHAHAQGVVHRDVKPSNVLIPEHSAGGQVAKLTDFGVARLIGADTLTRTGDVVGTAAYMAPEQADGREAGAAADLYSLALVLYEALTGVNPIALGLPAQRARRLGAHLPPLRRQRRDLPGDLGHALDQALRPRPRERGPLVEFRSELLAAVDQVADQPGVIESPWPRRTRTREWAGQPAWEDGPPGQVRDGPAMTSPAAASPVPPPGDAPAPAFPMPWPERALAGAAAGAAAAWVATLDGSSAGGAPAALGLVAALLVAVLPRLGWFTVVAGLAGLLAGHGRSGAAVIVALAGLLSVLVLA